MADRCQNAVILMGNTGCGKSYVSNRIFEVCGNRRRFESLNSYLSVTGHIQTEVVSYGGKNYTIIDCPGFFDNTSTNPGEIDGRNLCRLVEALEKCESIVAILYVYTDKFSAPQKIWFDRMNNLVSRANKGNIIMVHNKVDTDVDLKVQAVNEVGVNSLIDDGAKHPYVWFGFKAPVEQVRSLLDDLEKLPTFQLKNLVIPEICYEKEEEGPEYTEIIGERTQDHGHKETIRTDKSYFKTVEKWNRNTITGAFGLRGPGAKKTVQEYVPHMVTEEKWIPNVMTHRTTATYKDIYKVRFDNTKDLKEKKLLGQKEDAF